MEAAAVSSEQRRSALAGRIGLLVGQGWRVESQTELQVVLVKGKRPNHILHLILTVLTGGLWGLLVWLPLAIFKHEHRMVLTVDETGQVHSA